jgi:hypothetical protein
VTAPARLPLPLCRFDGHTCAACCWGEAVRPVALRAAVRRQTRLARRRFAGPRLPGPAALLRHELAARRGLDLLLGLLLLLPPVAAWLRPRLRRHLVCAFLAFEGSGEQRVGCLLHPSRWYGTDVRPRAAFRLLRGVACGPPDWYCLAAHWFAGATWEQRRDFARRTRALDWYAFSRAASAYACSTVRSPGFSRGGRRPG